jgi:hypothetical protein
MNLQRIELLTPALTNWYLARRYEKPRHLPSVDRELFMLLSGLLAPEAQLEQEDAERKLNEL